MELGNLKTKLKEKLTRSLDEGIEGVTKVLNSDKKRFNDVTHQSGRYNELIKQFDKGIISREDFDLNSNKVRNAIINIIEEITSDDINSFSNTPYGTINKKLANSKPFKLIILIGGIIIIISILIYKFYNNNNDTKQLKVYSESNTIEAKPDTILLKENEKQFLKHIFSNSIWDGGNHWGKIIFNEPGTIAVYSNTSGKSGGKIVLTAFNGYFFLGKWFQEDGKNGHFYISFPLVLSKDAEEFKVRAAWTIDAVSLPDEEFWQEWKEIRG